MEKFKQQIINTLLMETALLQKEVEAIQPGIILETLKDYSNEDGIITEDICIPIRAAIKLLKKRTPKKI